MIDPYDLGRGFRGRRPGRVEPEYTYQDVYGPAPQHPTENRLPGMGFQGLIPQQGGAYDPYEIPGYQTRQPQAVGQFDYENGRIVGSTDFYGNRFDTRGLPLGPEQARATQQLQAPQGPQEPAGYQYGGPQPEAAQQQQPSGPGVVQTWMGADGQQYSKDSRGTVYNQFGNPVGNDQVAGAAGAAPGGPYSGVGVAGQYLSPQNLKRAQDLGYDPVVFQQMLDRGMDPAEAERAAMTIAARTSVAGYSGYDPRYGTPTLARETYQNQFLGEAYRNDQRYQQALAGAAQQRMQAQQAGLRATSELDQQLLQKYLPVGRAPNTADINNAQAAMRADPTYWQQQNAARTSAQGGVTQGTQRAAGVLDRQGLSFPQAIEQVYGGNQYRYGA